MTEDDKNPISLPWMWAPESDGWGGPAVTNPATFHIMTEEDLGYELDKRVTLAQIVDDWIDGLCDRRTGLIDDDEGRALTTALIRELRAQADRLEQAMASSDAQEAE